LKTTQQFRDVYNNGKKIFDSLFLVFVLTRQTGSVRFGFTITKQIGSAVIRNRIKRQLREVVNALSGGFTGSADIVIIVRKKITTAPFKQIQSHLSDVLERAGLINPLLLRQPCDR
jgi:ribonuclease P protein component